jgi:hypothetical protein
LKKYVQRQIPDRVHRFLLRALVLAAAAGATTVVSGKGGITLATFANDSGVLGTFSTATPDGSLDTTNPFFQPLGKQFATTCEHCHFASDAFGISAATAQQLFNNTNGLHPLFSPPTANDFHAALALFTSENATGSDRAAAYSLMTSKGDSLVRRNFNAAAADFEVTAVIAPTLPVSMHTICVTDNGVIVPGSGPNSCPSGSTAAIPGADYLAYTALDNGANGSQIWVHRRPLPTTNFHFLTTAAWDGRDTRQSPNPITRPTIGSCTSGTAACTGGVAEIARATIGGRMTGPSGIAPDGHVYTGAELDALANQLTDLMASLRAAQETVNGVGSLSGKGARGGVINLANQEFHFGTNDVLQGDLTVFGGAPGGVHFNNTPFNFAAFNLYDAWKDDKTSQRAAIERGQALFGAPKLTISGVAGLNGGNPNGPDGYPIFPCTSTRAGDTGTPNCIFGEAANAPASFTGSCSVCHDSPNAGDHSTRLPINIGISDKVPAGLGRQAVADLPLFILTCKAGATSCTPGDVKQTTDPGRAVITGLFAHVGQFKGPILRGLSARAPFFHNGMAGTFEDVVNFYSARFASTPGGEAFTASEKADLVAFLKSL